MGSSYHQYWVGCGCEEGLHRQGCVKQAPASAVPAPLAVTLLHVTTMQQASVVPNARSHLSRDDCWVQEAPMSRHAVNRVGMCVPKQSALWPTTLRTQQHQCCTDCKAGAGAVFLQTSSFHHFLPFATCQTEPARPCSGCTGHVSGCPAPTGQQLQPSALTGP